MLYEQESLPQRSVLGTPLKPTPISLRLPRSLSRGVEYAYGLAANFPPSNSRVSTHFASNFHLMLYLRYNDGHAFRYFVEDVASSSEPSRMRCLWSRQQGW